MLTLSSLYHYCRLVIFSVGLQEVVKTGSLKNDTVFFTGVRYYPGIKEGVC